MRGPAKEDAAIRQLVRDWMAEGNLSNEQALVHLLLQLYLHARVHLLIRQTGFGWGALELEDVDEAITSLQYVVSGGYADDGWLELAEEFLPVWVTHLHRMPYRDYLQTPEWGVTRYFARRRAGDRCQVCDSPKRLEVHHRTYARRGAEALDDLTVLCRDCHGTFHEHGRLA